MPAAISTPRLTLLNTGPELLRILLNEGDAALAAHLHISVPRHWTTFGMEPFRYVFHRLLVRPIEAEWWTYLIVHQADQALIGSCGYKGPPDETGLVEIGYEVAESYRNQGYATELAIGLIQHAFRYPEVKCVSAHTLAEENASVHVLRKAGMQFVKELLETEDGAVWRWEIHRPPG